MLGSGALSANQCNRLYTVRMRILFTRFPLESRFGGAEVQTLGLMKGLKQRGHEVEFVGDCPTLSKEAVSYGLRAVSVSIGKPPVTKWLALSFLWRRKTIRKALVDHFTTHYPLPTTHSSVLCMLSLSEKLLLTDWAHQQGMKVLWIEHDRVGRWLRKNPWLPMLKRMSKFATIICVSELSKKLYVDMGFDSNRIVVIPNGIDLERLNIGNPQTIAHLSASYKLQATSSFHVGCISRLSEEKGVDVLIHAIRDLPEATLTIVGTGPQEGYLRSLVAELEQREHQTGRVNIVPNVKNLGDFYRSLNAFVLPSTDHDPFGLVAGEAMALGIPTVITEQCGIRGCLRAGQDAMVVDGGSVGDLAYAIRLLMKPDFGARIAENGKQIVREKLTMQAMIDGYEQLMKAGS